MRPSGSVGSLMRRTAGTQTDCASQCSGHPGYTQNNVSANTAKGATAHSSTNTRVRMLALQGGERLACNSLLQSVRSGRAFFSFFLFRTPVKFGHWQTSALKMRFCNARPLVFEKCCSSAHCCLIRPLGCLLSMSRRTTLGPLSGAALNTRASMGGARLTASVKPSRHSIAAGGAVMAAPAAAASASGRPSLAAAAAAAGGRASAGRMSIQAGRAGRPSMARFDPACAAELVHRSRAPPGDPACTAQPLPSCMILGRLQIVPSWRRARAR